jgi:hypothetical protein
VESFRPLLEDVTGYDKRDWSKGGKPPFDPVLMFKVLVLQKFHGLSDDATGEQIFDRASFKSFLGCALATTFPPPERSGISSSALKPQDVKAPAASLRPSTLFSKVRA